MSDLPAQDPAASAISPRPAERMRRLALAAPVLFLIALTGLALMRVLIERVPFAVRLDSAVMVLMNGYGIVFITQAPLCRDEPEFRRMRGWFSASLGLTMATAAALVASGRGTLGTAVAFAVALLMVGLLFGPGARRRWLAGQG